MPSITYDRFEIGIDRRKGIRLSDANRLWDLKNAYVTTGWRVKKRPGLTKVKTLTSGSIGLISSGGVLNTLSASGLTHSGGSVTVTDHALSDVQSGGTLELVESSTTYNGTIYAAVRFDNDDIEHHYLDAGAGGAGSASITGATNANPCQVTFASPHLLTTGMSIVLSGIGGMTEINGTWYQVTVVDATNVTLDGVDATGYGVYSGPSGSAQSRTGSRVSDGNCPNSEALLRTASKIFAIAPDTVRFTATASGPWDWSSANDAGFLPTGIRSPGDPAPRMLGLYNELLAVAASDSIQTWNVDPDPDLMSVSEIVENTGSTYPHSADNVSGDLYYLSDNGFESLSTLSLTNNLADIDVGSPITSLVVPELVDPTDIIVRSAFYQGGGQYWCVLDRVTEGDSLVFVYTFSRTAKVSAWSYYTYPFRISAIAELAGKLYLRSGNSVYRVDEDVYTDDGTTIDVEFRMTYQDFKKPGQRKHIHGLDLVQTGSGVLSVGYDARNISLFGPSITVPGDSRAGGMIPYELNATEISPRITHSANEAWELELLEFYYDLLGAM